MYVVLHRPCGGGLLGRTECHPLFRFLRSNDFTPPMGPRPMTGERVRIRCMRCGKYAKSVSEAMLVPMELNPSRPEGGDTRKET